MDLPGKRIRKWREHLGLNGKQFEAATGIPYSTLKTLENNEDPDKKPSFDVVTKILQTYGQLNPDWLLLGNEPMLRDGRTLVARVVEETPESSGQTGLVASKGGRQHDPYVDQLLQRITEQAKIIERLWQQNDTLLDRKPEASADAASLFDIVDEIASDYRYVPQVELPEIARFVPKRRELPKHETVGFRLQLA